MVRETSISRLEVNLGLPPGGRDRRLQAEPANDVFDFRVDPVRRGQDRADGNPPGTVQVVAFEATQRKPGADEVLKQER